MKNKLLIVVCVIAACVGFWTSDFIDLIYHSNETVETIDANALDGIMFEGEDAGFCLDFNAVAATDIVFDMNATMAGDLDLDAAIYTDIAFCGATSETNVLFTWKSGRFDVVYDANHCTQAALAFLEYVLPYLNTAIELKAKELNERNGL